MLQSNLDRPTHTLGRMTFPTVALVGLLSLLPHLSVASGSTSIGTDRQKISQIEQAVAAQGATVQNLVSHYDQISAQLAGIQSAIAQDHANLSVEHRAMIRASAGLRGLAVAAYVDQAAGSSPSLSSISNPSSGATFTAKQEYTEVANARLSQAITAYQVAQRATLATESHLLAKEALISQTLAQASSAKNAAQVALNSSDAALGKLSSNLQSLVTAANQARAAAAAAAQEKALAGQSSGTAQLTSVSSNVLVHPAAGSYVNPLRSVVALTPERIDMGVDFGGYGPIFAIGDGVVLSTYNGGWPGGTFISYRLTSGPDAGLVVYAAEDISPNVSVGQNVTANTVLGQMYEGPEGIETGWATSAADGVTEAAQYGEFYGGNTTAFGFNFSQLLSSLGAPGGVMQNNPPTGSLPAGW